MQPIRKIMVAIAFSEYSRGIFEYAARLANCLDADLLVANIINSRDVQAVGAISAMGYNVNGDDYVKGIEQERQAILDKIVVASAFPRERLKTVFKVGNPIDTLLKLIVLEEVDMIVMGLKGRTDLEHFFVGSVADKLFQRSPITVVSYRDGKIAERLKQKIHIGDQHS